jgi:hypothetical protein
VFVELVRPHNEITGVLDHSFLRKNAPRTGAEACVTSDCTWVRFTATFADETSRILFVRASSLRAEFHRKLREHFEPLHPGILKTLVAMQEEDNGCASAA